MKIKSIKKVEVYVDKSGPTDHNIYIDRYSPLVYSNGEEI